MQSSCYSENLVSSDILPNEEDKGERLTCFTANDTLIAEEALKAEKGDVFEVACLSIGMLAPTFMRSSYGWKLLRESNGPHYRRIGVIEMDGAVDERFAGLEQWSADCVE